RIANPGTYLLLGHKSGLTSLIRVVAQLADMWKEIICLLLFAVLLLTLSLTSVRQKSATFDEGLHIPAAYTYVAYGDFRLNPEHPPLVKLLSGLPLRYLQPRVDLND